jgi:hypothetical protein
MSVRPARDPGTSKVDHSKINGLWPESVGSQHLSLQRIVNSNCS